MAELPRGWVAQLEADRTVYAHAVQTVLAWGADLIKNKPIPKAGLEITREAFLGRQVGRGYRAVNLTFSEVSQDTILEAPVAAQRVLLDLGFKLDNSSDHPLSFSVKLAKTKAGLGLPYQFDAVSFYYRPTTPDITDFGGEFSTKYQPYWLSHPTATMDKPMIPDYSPESQRLIEAYQWMFQHNHPYLGKILLGSMEFAKQLLKS